jgi:UDP-2,3-diacylglucosamine pyrophosphatase LpxH
MCIWELWQSCERTIQLLKFYKTKKTLILNGDIIDIWQFRKSYFPKAHHSKIIGFATKGTKYTTSQVITMKCF